NTRDTVATETPASRATSLIVEFMADGTSIARRNRAARGDGGGTGGVGLSRRCNRLQSPTVDPVTDRCQGTTLATGELSLQPRRERRPTAILSQRAGVGGLRTWKLSRCPSKLSQ